MTFNCSKRDFGASALGALAFGTLALGGCSSLPSQRAQRPSSPPSNKPTASSDTRSTNIVFPTFDRDKTDFVEVGFSTDNPARLHYAERNNARGGSPTLLMMAGAGIDMTIWDEVADLIEDKYRLIRFDERGLGQSSKNAPGKTYKPWDDIAQILDRLQVKQTHVLAHGRGAKLAMDFVLSSAANAQRIQSLSLISPLITGYLATARWGREYGPVLAAARGNPNMASDLQRAKQLWLNSYLFDSTKQRPAVRRKLEQMLSRYDGYHFATEGTARQADAAITPAIYQAPSLRQSGTTLQNIRVASNRFQEIKQPTQVLIGAEEIDYFMLMAAEVARYIDNATPQTIAGGGHLVALESPRATAMAVQNFLNRSL